MSAKRLARYVDVYDDHGVAHCFGPGDEVPAWAVSKIKRADAWAEETSDNSPADTAGEDTETAEAVDDNAEDIGPDEPPRNGAGSGKDAWVAHASELGIDVTDDMSRDDIIEAVDSQ